MQVKMNKKLKSKRNTDIQVLDEPILLDQADFNPVLRFGIANRMGIVQPNFAPGLHRIGILQIEEEKLFHVPISGLWIWIFFFFSYWKKSQKKKSMTIEIAKKEKKNQKKCHIQKIQYSL